MAVPKRKYTMTLTVDSTSLPEMKEELKLIAIMLVRHEREDLSSVNFGLNSDHNLTVVFDPDGHDPTP